MAYKKAGEAATKNGIAELAKRVPPNQALKFKDFQAKHAEYLARVNKQPEKLPNIDWEYYKRYVRADFVKMVSEFEQKYKIVCDAFDKRYEQDKSKYFVEIDRLKKQVQEDVEKYKAASNERIKALEAKYAQIQSLIPYEEMTAEEAAELLPDKSFYRYNGEPSFWPHTPDEQGPGPSVAYDPGNGGGHGDGNDGPGGSGGSASSGVAKSEVAAKPDQPSKPPPVEPAKSSAVKSEDASLDVSCFESPQFKKDLEYLKKCFEESSAKSNGPSNDKKADIENNIKFEIINSIDITTEIARGTEVDFRQLNNQNFDAADPNKECLSNVATELNKDLSENKFTPMQAVGNTQASDLIPGFRNSIIQDEAKTGLPDLAKCLDEIASNALKTEGEKVTEKSEAAFMPVEPEIVTQTKVHANPAIESTLHKTSAFKNLKVDVGDSTVKFTQSSYPEVGHIHDKQKTDDLTVVQSHWTAAAASTKNEQVEAIFEETKPILVEIPKSDARKDLQANVESAVIKPGNQTEINSLKHEANENFLKIKKTILVKIPDKDVKKGLQAGAEPQKPTKIVSLKDGPLDNFFKKAEPIFVNILEKDAKKDLKPDSEPMLVKFQNPSEITSSKNEAAETLLEVRDPILANLPSESIAMKPQKPTENSTSQNELVRSVLKAEQISDKEFKMDLKADAELFPIKTQKSGEVDSSENVVKPVLVKTPQKHAKMEPQASIESNVMEEQNTTLIASSKKKPAKTLPILFEISKKDYKTNSEYNNNSKNQTVETFLKVHEPILAESSKKGAKIDLKENAKQTEIKAQMPTEILSSENEPVNTFLKVYVPALVEVSEKKTGKDFEEITESIVVKTQKPTEIDSSKNESVETLLKVHMPVLAKLSENYEKTDRELIADPTEMKAQQPGKLAGSRNETIETYPVENQSVLVEIRKNYVKRNLKENAFGQNEIKSTEVTNEKFVAFRAAEAILGKTSEGNAIKSIKASTYKNSANTSKIVDSTKFYQSKVDSTHFTTKKKELNAINAPANAILTDHQNKAINFIKFFAPTAVNIKKKEPDSSKLNAVESNIRQTDDDTDLNEIRFKNIESNEKGKTTALFRTNTEEVLLRPKVYEAVLTNKNKKDTPKTEEQSKGIDLTSPVRSMSKTKPVQTVSDSAKSIVFIAVDSFKKMKPKDIGLIKMPRTAEAANAKGELDQLMSSGSQLGLKKSNEISKLARADQKVATEIDVNATSIQTSKELQSKNISFNKKMKPVKDKNSKTEKNTSYSEPITPIVFNAPGSVTPKDIKPKSHDQVNSVLIDIKGTEQSNKTDDIALAKMKEEVVSFNDDSRNESPPKVDSGWIKLIQIAKSNFFNASKKDASKHFSAKAASPSKNINATEPTPGNAPETAASDKTQIVFSSSMNTKHALEKNLQINVNSYSEKTEQLFKVLEPKIEEVLPNKDVKLISDNLPKTDVLKDKKAKAANPKIRFDPNNQTSLKITEPRSVGGLKHEILEPYKVTPVSKQKGVLKDGEGKLSTIEQSKVSSAREEPFQEILKSTEFTTEVAKNQADIAAQKALPIQVSGYAKLTSTPIQKNSSNNEKENLISSTKTIEEPKVASLRVEPTEAMLKVTTSTSTISPKKDFTNNLKAKVMSLQEIIEKAEAVSLKIKQMQVSELFTRTPKNSYQEEKQSTHKVSEELRGPSQNNKISQAMLKGSGCTLDISSESDITKIVKANFKDEKEAEISQKAYPMQVTESVKSAPTSTLKSASETEQTKNKLNSSKVSELIGVTRPKSKPLEAMIEVDNSTCTISPGNNSAENVKANIINAEERIDKAKADSSRIKKIITPEHNKLISASSLKTASKDEREKQSYSKFTERDIIGNPKRELPQPVQKISEPSNISSERLFANSFQANITSSAEIIDQAKASQKGDPIKTSESILTSSLKSTLEVEESSLPSSSEKIELARATSPKEKPLQTASTISVGIEDTKKIKGLKEAASLKTEPIRNMLKSVPFSQTLTADSIYSRSLETKSTMIGETKPTDPNVEQVHSLKAHETTTNSTVEISCKKGLEANVIYLVDVIKEDKSDSLNVENLQESLNANVNVSASMPKSVHKTEATVSKMETFLSNLKTTEPTSDSLAGSSLKKSLKENVICVGGKIESPKPAEVYKTNDRGASGACLNDMIGKTKTVHSSLKSDETISFSLLENINKKILIEEAENPNPNVGLPHEDFKIAEPISKIILESSHKNEFKENVIYLEGVIGKAEDSDLKDGRVKAVLKASEPLRNRLPESGCIKGLISEAEGVYSKIEQAPEILKTAHPTGIIESANKIIGKVDASGFKVEPTSNFISESTQKGFKENINFIRQIVRDVKSIDQPDQENFKVVELISNPVRESSHEKVLENVICLGERMRETESKVKLGQSSLKFVLPASTSVTEISHEKGLVKNGISLGDKLQIAKTTDAKLNRNFKAEQPTLTSTPASIRKKDLTAKAISSEDIMKKTAASDSKNKSAHASASISESPNENFFETNVISLRERIKKTANSKDKPAHSVLKATGPTTAFISESIIYLGGRIQKTEIADTKTQPVQAILKGTEVTSSTTNSDFKGGLDSNVVGLREIMRGTESNDKAVREVIKSTEMTSSSTRLSFSDNCLETLTGETKAADTKIEPVQAGLKADAPSSTNFHEKYLNANTVSLEETISTAKTLGSKAEPVQAVSKATFILQNGNEDISNTNVIYLGSSRGKSKAIVSNAEPIETVMNATEPTSSSTLPKDLEANMFRLKEIIEAEATDSKAKSVGKSLKANVICLGERTDDSKAGVGEEKLSESQKILEPKVENPSGMLKQEKAPDEQIVSETTQQSTKKNVLRGLEEKWIITEVQESSLITSPEIRTAQGVSTLINDFSDNLKPKEANLAGSVKRNAVFKLKVESGHHCLQPGNVPSIATENTNASKVLRSIEDIKPVKTVSPNVQPVKEILKNESSFVNVATKSPQIKLITSSDFFEPTGDKINLNEETSSKVEVIRYAEVDAINESIKPDTFEPSVTAANWVSVSASVSTNSNDLGDEFTNAGKNTESAETSSNTIHVNPKISVSLLSKTRERTDFTIPQIQSDPVAFKGFTLVGMPETIAFRDSEAEVTRPNELFESSHLVQDHSILLKSGDETYSKSSRKDESSGESNKSANTAKVES